MRTFFATHVAASHVYLLTHCPSPFLFDVPLLQFLRTWNLFTSLVSPSSSGFGLDTMKYADTACRSLMAQYEALSIERDPKFTKCCSVSYGKMLLITSGK